MPLVSIIVPCFNAAPWLAKTLESLLAQTWAPCEIIVVDDGSRDTSLAVARSFASRGVRVIAQTNAGASAARNGGLREARGEFIQFLDADDLVTPDKIAAQVELLQSSGGEAVASCRWGRFATDPTAATFVDDAVFRDFSPIDYLLAHTGAARMIHPGAWLVPRTIAERVGPWDESLSLNDDGEYFARIALAASHIRFTPVGASLYRSNLPGSLSRRRDRRALTSLARSIELIAGHLLQAEDSPRVRQALANYWQRLVYELYAIAPDLCRHAEAQVLRFGGSTIRPEMGRRSRIAARLIGWKLVYRLRHSFRS